jgi:hypothetical protein
MISEPACDFHSFGWQQRPLLVFLRKEGITAGNWGRIKNYGCKMNLSSELSIPQLQYKSMLK